MELVTYISTSSTIIYMDQNYSAFSGKQRFLLRFCGDQWTKVLSYFAAAQVFDFQKQLLKAWFTEYRTVEKSISTWSMQLLIKSSDHTNKNLIKNKYSLFFRNIAFKKKSYRNPFNQSHNSWLLNQCAYCILSPCTYQTEKNLDL